MSADFVNRMPLDPEIKSGADIDLQMIEDALRVGGELLPAVEFTRPGPEEYAPPHVRENAEVANAIKSAPAFVEPRGEVSRVGVLTSVALANEYDAASQRIVDLGNELKRMLERLEELGGNVRNVVEHLNKTAEHYRNEGKMLFKEIEECAIKTEEARRLSEIMRQKLRAASSS